MRFIANLKTLLVLFLGFGLLACGSDSNDAMENTEDAVEDTANEIADVFRSDKEEMKAEIDRTREEVNEEIEELQGDLENASESAKAEIQKEIDQLKAWSSDLDQKIQNLGNVAQDSWKDFKTNVNSTLEKIDQELSGDN
ncbi:MAG: hypothetical protein RIC19_21165 [Phaeodactylibacter sp.]|uniref:hypothetical protein n=1 Tax=Phaeodactylibacter sp. TaxID=1940289 RepID=UPI0032EEACA9